MSKKVRSRPTIPLTSVLEMTRELNAYLKQNYTDPDLSLSALSSIFHMTESSLSKFFKAKFGINFSTYLEKLRLNEAKSLLAATDLTVSEIANRVGYVNITTFYKAFKRKQGIPPSEWAQQHGRNGLIN